MKDLGQMVSQAGNIARQAPPKLLNFAKEAANYVESSMPINRKPANNPNRIVYAGNYSGKLLPYQG